MPIFEHRFLIMAEVILTINGRKIENTFTKLRRETRALERELRNLVVN